MADDPRLFDRIHNDFDFHPTNELGSDDGLVIASGHEEIRSACKDLAVKLASALPAGRELSTALTKLEEVMFWSNAALARNQAGFLEGLGS